MTQAPKQLPANSSRLVRFLADLAGGDVAAPPGHFAQRLGQVFDLPDSIRIAAVHSGLPATFAATGIASREIREGFLQARAAIVNAALRSFVPGGGSPRLRFPVCGDDTAIGERLAPAPYLAFYAAQQRDIDARIRNLRAGIRDELAGFSPELAQLAALDAALGDPLAIHGRSSFSAVSRQLGQRIEVLRAEYQLAAAGSQSDTNLWSRTRAQLRAEMQGLLLAEIDTRLLPTVGLIEALEENEDD